VAEKVQSKASVPMEKPQGIKPTSPRSCSLPFAARVIRLRSPRNDVRSLALNDRTGPGLFIVRAEGAHPNPNNPT
jgi:hypothetical protein